MAAVEPERVVAGEELAAGQGLACGGGEEGEVRGPRGVGGGDAGDVDFQVDGSGVEVAEVDEDGAVADVVVALERVGGHERRQVEGFADEAVADPRRGFEVVDPWQGHGGTPAFKWSRRDRLCVLPVAGPGYGDLGLVTRNAVEELAGVVVLAEVGDPGHAVDGVEMRSVKVSRCVLGDAAAQRCARVDGD